MDISYTFSQSSSRLCSRVQGSLSLWTSNQSWQKLVLKRLKAPSKCMETDYLQYNSLKTAWVCIIWTTPCWSLGWPYVQLSLCSADNRDNRRFHSTKLHHENLVPFGSQTALGHNAPFSQTHLATWILKLQPLIRGSGTFSTVLCFFQVSSEQLPALGFKILSIPQPTLKTSNCEISKPKERKFLHKNYW